MTPEVIRQWQRIIRDTLIVIVGTFILVYETVWARDPNLELIVAALTCFGLPTALRLDLRDRDIRDKEIDKDDRKA